MRISLCFTLVEKFPPGRRGENFVHLPLGMTRLADFVSVMKVCIIFGDTRFFQFIFFTLRLYFERSLTRKGGPKVQRMSRRIGPAPATGPLCTVEAVTGLPPAGGVRPPQADQQLYHQPAPQHVPTAGGPSLWPCINSS